MKYKPQIVTKHLEKKPIIQDGKLRGVDKNLLREKLYIKIVRQIGFHQEIDNRMNVII